MYSSFAKNTPNIFWIAMKQLVLQLALDIICAIVIALLAWGCLQLVHIPQFSAWFSSNRSIDSLFAIILLIFLAGRVLRQAINV